MNGKGIIKMIILIVLVIIVIGGFIGWSYLEKEHKEAKNLPIAVINFKKLKEGTYIGEYEGGMYKWRYSKVQVEVSSGKVEDIKLLSSAGPGAEQNKDYNTIYERIINEQTLQVDVVSGATLTSKAYIKAVENALLKAENND